MIDINNKKKNLDSIGATLRETVADEIEIIDLKIKRKKSGLSRIAGYFSIFLIISLFFFGNRMSISENSSSSSSWFYNLPIVKQIKQLALSSETKLKGEKYDRINILLLGMGGRQHEGGYLTDTIMLASLEPSTKKIALVSIPRDLDMPMENSGWQKINSVNAYAEMENPGSGGMAVSQAVSDLLDLPIDYYVRIDFEGFINIINLVDGIGVMVDNTLNDYEYPIMGRETAEDYSSRFEHLYIEAGWQEMDGELALKYARSRHGGSGEGSDFARARRQQKILLAVKTELLNAKNLLKPKMLSDIVGELNEHVSTNLKVWEMLKLWDMFKDIQKENITNKVLDNSANSLLIESRNENGAYVLLPRSGDFAEIQYFVNNVFSDAPKEQKTIVAKEKSSIEVRNGTWINGLASRVSMDLEKYGFTVVRIGNSSRQNFQKSVIYDLTYGEKAESLEILKAKTNANVSLELPEWLAEDIKQEVSKEFSPIQPDFILVLGQDADATSSGEENKE
ncbi:MAG: LCP family protein [bacterium]